MRNLHLACNRSLSPNLKLDQFLATVTDTGAVAVEIRNDIGGREFADGTPAGELGKIIEAAGLNVASVNALQRFNDWNPERANEARFLIRYASALGAPGVVLCPVVDTSRPWSEGECAAKLREALRAIAPICADHGVLGYVEPLGMPGSTLRYQSDAVEAIDDVDEAPWFQLCYDTFQYFRASDTLVFPDQIGLVHVSGVTRVGIPRHELIEPDRGLVDSRDISETISQLKTLLKAGYEGYISIEPFDPEVQSDPNLRQQLEKCIKYLEMSLAV